MYLQFSKVGAMFILAIMLWSAVFLANTHSVSAQFLSRDSLLQELQSRRNQGMVRDSAYVRLLFSVARSYRPNTTQMRLFVDEARPLVATLKNPHLVGNLYENAGNILRLERRFTEARDTMLLALQIFEQEQDSFKIAALYGLLALMYQQRDMYATALQYYQQQIEIGDKIREDKNGFLARVNVAEIYLVINQPTKALNFLREAEQMMHRVQNTGFRIEWTKSMSATYRLLEKPDSALVLAREGIRLAWSMEDTLQIVNLLAQEIRANAAMKRFDKALLLVDSIVRLDTVFIADKKLRPSTSAVAAEALTNAATQNPSYAFRGKQGRTSTTFSSGSILDKALQYCAQALKHPLLRGKEKLEILTVQTRIYNALRQPTEELRAQTALLKLKDSLFTERLYEGVMDIQEQAEISAKEREILALTEREQRSTIITILLLALAIVGIVAAIVVVQRYRAQLRYDAALQEKNEALQQYIETDVEYKQQIEEQNIALINKEQAMRFLLQEKELLAIVADNTLQSVVITDAEGRTQYVNRAFEAMTGYALSEVIGKKPGSVLQGKDTDVQTVQNISKALHERRAIGTDIINYTKEGRQYWLHLAISPVFDAEGECSHFVSIQQDITERLRLQAEERLQADLTLQSMLDSAKDITLLVGADFRLIKCNKAAYQAMRAIQPDKEPEIGTDLREYSPIPISTVERDFANVLQGQSVSFDIDVQDALQPHEKRTFEVQYNPVRNLQGEIIAVSFVARNITQRRIAQEQIERANAWLEERVQERTQDLEVQAQELSAANTKLRVAYSELELSQLRIWESQQKLETVNRSLEEANTEKNEIMGIVAHDLKSPLSGIQGLAELLAAGGVAEAEQVKEVGLQMFRSTERMFSLITNLLSLNTIEAGQMPIRITTVALNPIVKSFVEIYANQAATKDITIMAEIPSALLFGLVDELAFRQVLDNLISNAVKYSPHGKNVYVRLKADNNVVRFEVQDEGPGISADDMQKLFGKFVRLSARPTGGEHSTGLGLSIVKKMVEAMNGKVWCESELGNGATFIVELPMAKN